jgi:ABC-2 type transport system permease protein
MAIFTLVFRFFLDIPVPEGDPSGLKVFALYLLCALLPWNFLANTMTGGMAALIGNANLLNKVYFPREILVAANVASWVFSLVIELLVLAIVLLVAGNMVLPWLPALVLVVILQAVFALGLALLLSVGNVYFRDVQHLVGIALQMWFYATPIVYPITYVIDADKDSSFPLLRIYELNPMVHFVEVYRDLLYHLRGPELGSVLYLLVVSFALFAVGYAVFRRLEPRLAEEL